MTVAMVDLDTDLRLLMGAVEPPAISAGPAGDWDKPDGPPDPDDKPGIDDGDGDQDGDDKPGQDDGGDDGGGDPDDRGDPDGDPDSGGPAGDWD